jgi:hypothetical protein
MLMTIRQFLSELRRYDKDIRQVRNKQVFNAAIKERGRGIVDRYFREAREQLVISGITDLSSIDSAMQHLLEITQKNSAVATYRSQIRAVEEKLKKVEQELLLPRTSGQPEREPVDDMIIGALSNILPSAARSYEQAICDLRSKVRLSWRGPATDLRESLRETLDHLAPDDDVTKEAGFKLEKDALSPTMKQKVRYILRKRGVGRTAMQAPESATEAIDELMGTFVRGVYSRSSVSTHTPTDRNEILRIRDLVRVSLCELLQVRMET